MPVRKTWPEPWVYFWSRLIGPWLIPIFALLNPGPNGSFYLVVQFVRTSLCRFPRPAHHNSGQWSPASADSNFMPDRVAAIFALCRSTGRLRNDVTRSPAGFALCCGGGERRAGDRIIPCERFSIAFLAPRFCALRQHTRR